MALISSHLPSAAAASATLILALLVSPVDSARAGGFTACEYPFIFSGSAANIVPIEYQATAVDRDAAAYSTDETTTAQKRQRERLARIQETARNLAWLVKLDSWHQPTYGSLGVVAHIFQGGTCEPDQVLQRLIQGGASEPVRPGQAIVMLQGRVFIEDDQVFLQSRIRGFRRNELPPDVSEPPGALFADEALTGRIGGDGPDLRASLPVLDVTFTPRAFSLAEFRKIDKDFRTASAIYPERSSPEEDARALNFKSGQHAFSVQIVDEQWLKVEDYFSGMSGFIKIKPNVSEGLHAKLPELDFLNGLLGFLRVRQAVIGSDYPPPPQSAPAAAQASLDRFLASKATSDDADARALAHAMIGVLHGSADKGWGPARKSLEKATEIAPFNGAYRNLLGVADAMLCCAGSPRSGYDDPSRSFVDSLSVNPGNREALLNLDAFLEYLDKTGGMLPKGIDATRLAERRAVVRKVVDSIR